MKLKIADLTYSGEIRSLPRVALPSLFMRLIGCAAQFSGSRNQTTWRLPVKFRGPLAALLMLFVIPVLQAADQPDAKNVELPVKQLGLTTKDAVEVCEPAGERQYLARLICPGGLHPEFNRLGSFGERTPLPDNMSEEESDRYLADMLDPKPLKPGESDYHITDGYEVRCGHDAVVIYLDMYHCSQPAPAVAPPGFSIIN